MFYVIVRLPRYEQLVLCPTYAAALDRKEFEMERCPEAVVTVEPSF